MKTMLELIKKLVPFQQGVVISTMPRGGLQVCQPSRLPSGFVKAFAQGGDAQDHLSWQSILKQKPVQPASIGSRESFAQSDYARELMAPGGLVHVVAFPLGAPVFRGYPGSVHLLRTQSQGGFTGSQIASVMSAVKSFEHRRLAGLRPRKGGSADSAAQHPLSRRPPALIVMDSKLRLQIGGSAWASLDGHLKDQVVDYVKRRFHQLGTADVLAGRAHFLDAHSIVWTYRVVACKRYAALGKGPICFLCLAPSCDEWTSLKAADFAADPEIVRLIPAIRFMRRAFCDGPALANIAGAAGLSAFHFHRRFTELFGMTPKQYMLDCQIHKAKADLIDGSIELADIASGCGFSHQSHFTSRFKQATGHTPTRWRHVVRSRVKR